MMKTRFALAVTAAILMAGTAFAQAVGTAAEAKAMLKKAAAAVTANKPQALEMFTKGKGGFKDRDLYPYCGGPDGMFTAHPKLVGQSLKDLTDKAGKPIGQEIYAKAKPGTVSKTTSMWPKPEGGDPVARGSYFTRIGDQVCAVDYQK